MPEHPLPDGPEDPHGATRILARVLLGILLLVGGVLLLVYLLRAEG